MRSRRLRLLVMGLALTTRCAAPGPPASPTEPLAAIASITITGPSANPTVGSSASLAALANYTNGHSADVTGAALWESSDPSVATVSPAGIVTARGIGSTEIRATFQAVTGGRLMAIAPSAPVTTLPVANVLVGIVRDSANNGVIPAAQISVKETSIATFSDLAGTYRLPVPERGTLLIRATRPGFEVAEIAVFANGETTAHIWMRAVSAPSPIPPVPAGNGVVINEFRLRGPAGAADEFIELRNDSSTPVSIGGWRLEASDASGGTTTRRILPAGISLGPGCHFLLANSNTVGGPYSGGPSDETYGVAIVDDGGLALRNASGTIVDAVGLSAGSAFGEGTRLAQFGSANTDRSYKRIGVDTDNNAADFTLSSPSTPQTLGSSCAVRIR